ncbi:putative helicase [Trypanosoma conorhini]|uniref:Putative helicase n=1 Tax=Trypanosoma conorhini TaxID=83891 RepID=A0A422NVK0_9TRYP|nr:putative helicase [Trypanosoma conorhini]RNF09477.1 putative helicase [Trypanosoma conorhini]
MRHAKDAGTTQGRPPNVRGLDRAAVSTMERFPIGHKSALPMCVDAEVVRNSAGRLPSANAGKFRPAAHLADPRAPAYGADAAAWRGTAPDTFGASGGEGGRPSGPVFWSRSDREEKIKTETIRRACLLVEQQLRLRQAEAELARWEAAMEDVVQRGQRGGEEGAKAAAPGASAAAAKTPDTDGGRAGACDDGAAAPAEGGSVVPLVSIRSLGGAASRTAPLNATAGEELERMRQGAQGGPLRGLLERPRDSAGEGEGNMEEPAALTGRGMGRRVNIRPRKAVHPPEFALTLSEELPPAPGSSGGGGGAAAAAAAAAGGVDAADDVIVRRLVGVPNHDRGLYAALRSGWKKACRAKTLARMLFGKRVRASTWWKLAGSREGMLAAARGLGLEPDVYEALMTRWMENERGAERAARHELVPQGERPFGGAAHATALTNAPQQPQEFASLASLLFAGDKDLSSMGVLAHQLGRLQVSGVVTPEEVARILEGDEESIRDELARLLESDAARQHAARLAASPSLSLSLTGGANASFHDVAKALLRERRRAATADKRSGESASVSGRVENRPASNSYLGPVLHDSASQPSLGEFFVALPDAGQRGLLPSLSSGEKAPSWASVAGAERQALWEAASEGERRPLRESMTGEERRAATAAAGGAGSADPYTRLPPLRGPDAGEAVVLGPGRGRPGRGTPAAAAGWRVRGRWGDTAASSEMDPLEATQAPGGRGSTGSAEGERSGLPPPSGAGGEGGEQRYDGPEWWKQRQRRPPPGAKSGWAPAEGEGEDEGARRSPDRPAEGADLIDLLNVPREPRRRGKSFRRAAGADNGEFGSEAEAKSGVRFSPQWSLEHAEDGSVRHRPKKVPRFLYDGKPRKSLDASMSSSGPARAGRARIPPFVRRPKSKPAGPVIAVADDASEDDSGELSSFFGNDDEDLTLFLATFPEEVQHVRLRNEARGVLGELKEASSLLVNYATNVRHRLPEGYTTAAPRESISSATAMAQAEEELKTKVSVDELRQRFESEGREEYAELWRTLQELRQKVLEQEAFLKESLMDVANLSRPVPGEDRDAFALRLTREVNEYAKTHRLDQRHLVGSAGMREDYAAAVQAFLDSFALTRGRRPGRDVGCQCTPEDLGYVDEELRRLEEEMEDLYFHARGLFSAIKLTIIAVGNVMGFHASLELETTCKHCFYIFESPRTLWPCGHTFCQQCLPSMFTEQGELICEECGSLCEVGYTPNLALELLASYQVMQRTDYDDEEEEEEFGGGVQRRTIEGVLATMLKDLMSTQTASADAPRRTAGGRLRRVSSAVAAGAAASNPPGLVP